MEIDPTITFDHMYDDSPQSVDDGPVDMEIDPTITFDHMYDDSPQCVDDGPVPICNSAALLIQKCWRLYRCAGVPAAIELDAPSLSSFDDDAVIDAESNNEDEPEYTTIVGGKYAGDECIVLAYLPHMVRIKLVSGRITVIRRQSLGLEKIASPIALRRSPRLSAIAARKVRRSARLAGKHSAAAA